jgi:hypothetical protein
LTDIANIVGNPRAPVGGALYEQQKEYLRSNQMNQLTKRHQMFDDAFKQSQTLPTEVQTQPGFEALAKAKAALEKDAADGKIDNEKNVSGFLTEMSRARTDLEKLMQQTATTRKLEEEQALEAGRAAQQGQRRTALEEIANNPSEYSPEQVRAAQLQLQALKAQDFETRTVGDQELTLSGGDWAKFAMQAERDKAESEQRATDMAGRERMHRESLGASERLRTAALGQRAGQQSAKGAIAGVQASLRRGLVALKRQASESPETVEPGAEDIVYKKALAENENAIVNAAERSGIQLRRGGIDIGGENPNLYVVNGQPFDVTDEEERLEMLGLLVQLIGSGGGSFDTSFEE